MTETQQKDGKWTQKSYHEDPLLKPGNKLHRMTLGLSRRVFKYPPSLQKIRREKDLLMVRTDSKVAWPALEVSPHGQSYTECPGPDTVGEAG